MKEKLLCIALIGLLSCAAYSQTTEFTYQGNLKVGPSPTLTTVNYDFEFRLCTSDTLNCTGPVLVGTDTHLNVPVTDGIFTVKLNFSAANAFDGSARWLLIGVKPAGDPGGYQVLTPRQQVMSTPYAIRSKNSGELGGIAASQYLQTNGNGSALTNLNASNITSGTLAINRGGTGSATQNFVDLTTDQTSIGGNKTFNGNTRIYPTFGNGQMFIRNRSNANYSQLVFNDDLDTYRGYIGYIGANAGAGARNDTVEVGTNGKDLTFRPNEAEVMRLTASGNVGINGYTKLGSDAPSIRVKKLTGTTSGAPGGVVFAHGLDHSKILSISVLVNYEGSAWIGPSYLLVNGYHFTWVLDGGYITVYNVPGQSAFILSKPLKILITYEQ